MRKLQLGILLTSISALTCSPPASANRIFSLEDVSYETHTAHYNKLPEVEDADRRLQSAPKFKYFLQKAEEVITRYELKDYAGFRLIHKHFSLPQKTIMLDNYEEFEGTPSLVTYAHTPEEALEKEGLPSSWIFKTKDADDMEMFEASSDPAVRDGVKLISKESEFMEEIARLLESNGLHSLLSLAILKRHSLTPHDNEQVSNELNYDFMNKSVIQIWDLEKVRQDSIATSWGFGGIWELRCWVRSYCERLSPFYHSRRAKHVR